MEKSIKKDEKTNKKEKKLDLKSQRDRDRELVKGIFRYHEVPGGYMGFVFRKYKEDPTEKYNFIDGQVYTIPRGVAVHLNNNGWYPVHSFQQDEYGKHTTKIGKKVRRFSFQSLEFVDLDEDSGEGILTVESV